MGLIDTIKTQLVGTSTKGATPAIRITLNAGYYLGVVTGQWKDNNDKYPNLSQ